MFDFSTSLHPSHRRGGVPTFEALLDADIVISDRGTMVYEAWALNKPVVFPTWIIGSGNREKSIGSAENLIFQERIGYHAESFDEMIDMIRSVKTPDERVRIFMEDYLPSRVIGKSNNLLAEEVNKIWESGELSIMPRVSSGT